MSYSEKISKYCDYSMCWSVSMPRELYEKLSLQENNSNSQQLSITIGALVTVVTSAKRFWSIFSIFLTTSKSAGIKKYDQMSNNFLEPSNMKINIIFL